MGRQLHIFSHFSVILGKIRCLYEYAGRNFRVKLIFPGTPMSSVGNFLIFSFFLISDFCLSNLFRCRFIRLLLSILYKKKTTTTKKRTRTRTSIREQ